MGIITNMRNRMQVVMWTILVLFIISMAIGGLVGGASIGDIFGQQNGNHIGSLNGKPILYENFNRLVSDEITRVQSQSGQDISDEDREYIRAVVWERMIQDLIIQEQIENVYIHHPSNQDIIEKPKFQKNKNKNRTTIQDFYM